MGLNNFFFIIQFVILSTILFILQIIRNKSKNRCIMRIQLGVLLLYSLFFLYSADWKYCLCVAVDTFIAYGCGVLIHCTEDEKTQRKIAAGGGIGLIAVLAYFKYTNFFIESYNKLFGLNTLTLNIMLPLGISFFTFSALSYVIDVYKGKCEAERNLVDFGLYMVFFPKITAGPIVRWEEFKSQIKKYPGIRLNAIHDGVQIFAFGLFKKMVLADHLGVFVDDVFLAPSVYNTGTVIFSAVSYSLQIYLDFSGYSDMAIGLAKITGFEFSPNFNLPYMARGFSDFWSRWHISLSTWFKDYLYIPLGGSRKGEKRTYINLFIVMLVSGLWHGAGWNFIWWGALHGIANCITRWLRKRNIQENMVLRGLEATGTFLLVTLFWTVFRAESMEKAVLYWKAMFTFHSGISQPYTWTFVAIICVAAATLTAIRKAKKNKILYVNGFYPILDLSNIWSLVIFFTFLGVTILLGYYGNTAFIYGGF